MHRRKPPGLGLFEKIAQKFSMASAWHFDNNPTRKITTSHLRVNSNLSKTDKNEYSQILRKEQSKRLHESAEYVCDENDLYGFVNEFKHRSDVLGFHDEYQDPSRLANASHYKKVNKMNLMVCF